MKIEFSIILPLLATIVGRCLAQTAGVDAVPGFRPLKLSFADIKDSQVFNVNAKAKLYDALRNVGMVSITDIPNFQEPKAKTLSLMHACMLDTKSFTQEQTYSDGTVRQTIASHTLPKEGAATLPTDSEACQRFAEASEDFRNMVKGTTQLFSERLASILEGEKNYQDNDHKPLLETNDETVSYDSVSSVVEGGEHLEHFHVYKKCHNHHHHQQQEDDQDTISWHIDQGLFLVFTPGLMLNLQSKDTTGLTDGFYIQLQDGSIAMTEFDETDDLVFLLGDGVNQFVNPHYDSDYQIRATPHALRMSSHSETEARVWYGRMVLPPADAIHPIHQYTFGELRDIMLSSEAQDDNDDDSVLALGCSKTMIARELSDTTCDEDQFFCWHRCFNHTEEASPAACEARQLSLACITSEDELWTGLHNPAFGPGCVDLATAKNWTDGSEESSAVSVFVSNLIMAIIGVALCFIVVE